MKPLFVETLQLNNYRNFKNKTLSFHQFNIITGDVATGKTNILESLTVLLSSYLLGFQTYMSKKNIIDINKMDVRKDNLLSIYPVSVSGTFRDGKAVSRILLDENKKTKFEQPNPFMDDNVKFENLMKEADNSDKNEVLPILLYLSVHRLCNPEKKTRGQKLQFWNKMKYDRLDGYYRCFDRLVDMDYLCLYLKRMCLIAYEELDGIPFPAYSVILKTLNSVLNEENQELVFTMKDDLDTIALKCGDSKIPMVNLNSGLQNLIKIILSICVRMSMLNPYLKEDICKTPGIVLIDELELGLDPMWQKKITNILIELFPNVQFICTTNSALVLGKEKAITI